MLKSTDKNIQKKKENKTMTNRDKAAQILAVLARIHRPMVFTDVEDIEYGCSEKELDFYYFWIVQGGKFNGHETR